MTAATFTTSVNRLLAQVSHWEQPRWSSPAAGGSGTRADVVFTLVQQLADLGADAESRERRPVPREHDLVLADQLRVMAADLVEATPPDALLADAATAVETTRKAFP